MIGCQKTTASKNSGQAKVQKLRERAGPGQALKALENVRGLQANGMKI